MTAPIFYGFILTIWSICDNIDYIVNKEAIHEERRKNTINT